MNRIGFKTGAFLVSLPELIAYQDACNQSAPIIAQAMIAQYGLDAAIGGVEELLRQSREEGKSPGQKALMIQAAVLKELRRIKGVDEQRSQPDPSSSVPPSPPPKSEPEPHPQGCKCWDCYRAECRRIDAHNAAVDAKNAPRRARLAERKRLRKAAK